jgi:hypothetical protein
VRQTGSQHMVHQVFERHVALSSDVFELRSHIVGERQCRSHASQHTGSDALMSWP